MHWGAGLAVWAMLSLSTRKEGYLNAMCLELHVQRRGLTTKEIDTTFDLLSLNPCSDGRWCCNNLTAQSCCDNDEGVFAFNLLAESVESSPSTTGTYGGTSATVTVTAYQSSGTTSIGTTNATSCPHDKTTVVGASVGAALGGSLVAVLVALLCVVKRRRKQDQEVPLPRGPQIGPESGWRVEMDSGSKGPKAPAQEIDGRQVH
jgi:hypothetical protein